jgi:hypothetical protein
MKKYGANVLILILPFVVAAVIALGSGEVSSDDMMFEAAQKRLNIKGLELGGEDVSKKVSWEEKKLLKQTYITVFTDILIQESLKKKPQVLSLAKEKVLERKPQLYQIYVSSDLDTEKHIVLARDTSSCTNVPKVFQVETLEKTARLLCLDSVLDDLSFASLGAKLEVETLPIDSIEAYPDAAALFDQLIEAELRNLVTMEFLGVYKKTGKISLM